ncbi:hypothetical protein D1345_19720 [Chromobacterium rhizoryzae]|uniref:Uncharacterized protein n=1 Tax=Chromobacterium rhizoryzae TaxID=1778675 RepID=A0AAD0RW66_9NEIS|nr:hypothetical protein D1345_19720 [Chromobacterium rhizoryzae]
MPNYQIKFKSPTPPPALQSRARGYKHKAVPPHWPHQDEASLPPLAAQFPAAAQPAVWRPVPLGLLAGRRAGAATEPGPAARQGRSAASHRARHRQIPGRRPQPTAAGTGAAHANPGFPQRPAGQPGAAQRPGADQAAQPGLRLAGRDSAGWPHRLRQRRCAVPPHRIRRPAA